MAAQPTVLSSATPYVGKLVTLRVDQVRFESGGTGERVVVSHPGATVILAIDDQQRILWIRQNRYAIGRELLELPAGGLEPGEEPIVCATRELAGGDGVHRDAVSARRLLHRAGLLHGAPLRLPGHGPARAVLAGDEDEDITVVPLTLEESLAKVDSGEIEDAKSLSTLFLYLRKHTK